MKNACKILIRFPEGKRPLGRPKRRRQHCIKTHIREIVWEDIDWDNMSQESVTDSREYDNENSASINGREIFE
jgi:hypothetical protein